MTSPVPPSPDLISALQSLTDAIKTNTTAIGGGGAGGSGGGMGVESLANAASKLEFDLESLSTKISNTTLQKSLSGAIGNIEKELRATADAIEDAQQKIAAGATIDLTPFRSEMAKLQNDLTKLSRESQLQLQAYEKLRKSLNMPFGDMIKERIALALNTDPEAFNIVVGKFTAVLSGAMKMAAEGIQKAASLSLTAQEGVAMEFTNQYQSVKSIFTMDPNRIVSKEALYAAQESALSAMGGMREGMELNAEGIKSMVQDMRTGLNSQIVPTAETFRTLSMVGLRPTIEDMNKLREATGRAALGQPQLDVLNRNRSALQIFGLQVGKTALDLERAGISFQAVMAGGESYVTNLDGALDSIAQLNQLGSNIDFGQLTMLSEFDPAKALEYASQNISTEQLQSSSFRALLQSLPGIDMQSLLAMKGLDNLGQVVEDQATKEKESTNIFTDMLSHITLSGAALAGSFVSLITGMAGSIFSTYRLITTTNMLNATLAKFTANLAATPTTPAAGATPAAGTKPTNQTATNPNTTVQPMTPAPTLGGGAKGGAAIGAIGGAVSGVATYMQGGSLKKSILMAIGPLIGGVIGGMLGSLFAGSTFGLGAAAIPILSTLGSSLGAAITASLTKTMDDGISTPEAGRTLTTSAGTFALNPNDTVVAGTNLGGDKKQSASQDNSKEIESYMRKIDELVAALKSANTVINVPGYSQTVNRMELVGVYTRDENMRGG